MDLVETSRGSPDADIYLWRWQLVGPVELQRQFKPDLGTARTSLSFCGAALCVLWRMCRSEAEGKGFEPLRSLHS